ncbi:uncharacterized protein LOC113792402 [Dermatophagoides pteronyssinus]|uniref:uncharacterized protein LOC113792402 n=1 Tax=Dermatophagoides pteronyssinus TaxID=6956 RepID=UPI003F663F15
MEKSFIKPMIMKIDEDLIEYLEYYERVSHAIDWDDKLKAKLFPAFLPNHSEALRILNSMNENDKKSFKKIKECFFESGKPKRNLIVQTLLNLKRSKDEQLSRLASRVQELTLKAYPNAKTIVRNLLARDIFINALQPSLKVKTLAIPDLPENIDEVINLIGPMDLASNRFNFYDKNDYFGSSFSSDTDEDVSCDFCGRKNHVSEDCYFKKKNEENHYDFNNVKNKVGNQGNSNNSSNNRIERKEINAIMVRKQPQCFTKIKINQVETLAMIDSGSDVSVIPMNKRFLSNEEIETAKVSVSGITKDNMKILGETFASFELNDIKFKHKMVVSDFDHVILGYDLFSSKDLQFSSDFKTYLSCQKDGLIWSSKIFNFSKHFRKKKKKKRKCILDLKGRKGYGQMKPRAFSQGSSMVLEPASGRPWSRTAQEV